MADEFTSFADAVIQPARNLAAITPHDSNDLATVSKALWIGGAGNVSIIAADDSAAVLISGVPAGTILPVRVKRVLATNTTATLIVNLC